MTYFNIALVALSGQKTDLLTSKGLSDLLRDVRLWKTLPLKHFRLSEDLLDLLSDVPPHPTNREVLRRIMADPKGWTEAADDATKDGADHYARMGQFLDPEKMAEIIRYHIIRENITDLQLKLGLDSVLGTKEIRILNGSCVVNDVDDQLARTDRDRELIRADVPKIAQLFINQIIDSGMYSLHEALESEELIDSSIGEVYQSSLSAIEASVYSSTADWIFDGECYTSTKCDRDAYMDADEITLYLQFADASMRVFKAMHKDLTRFPWLAD